MSHYVSFCPTLDPQVSTRTITWGEKDLGQICPHSCSLELSRVVAPGKTVYFCALLPVPVGAPPLGPLSIGSVLSGGPSQSAVGCHSPSRGRGSYGCVITRMRDLNSNSGVMSILSERNLYSVQQICLTWKNVPQTSSSLFPPIPEWESDNCAHILWALRICWIV